MMPERRVFLIILLSICALVYGQSDNDEIIRLDILSATKNELIQRAEALGLDPTGTAKVIINRLFSYYKIPTEKEKEAGSVFVIKTAESSSSFKVDEINEDYISFSGNIYLIYDNADDKTRHIIEANKITINNSKKLISAVGNVKYELESKEKSDVYYGDEVIVHLDKWNGYFFKGLSQTTKTVKDEDGNESEIIFYFTGKNIERTKDEWIILNKGSITSSNPDNPNYNISASKIIMPVPGEWLITNAVLYIGHIPVFYIPYFYYAKDKMIIHPSIGFYNEEGYNFQSTLYIYGKSAQKDEGFSFFQLTESDSDNLTGDGLFLRPEDESFGHNLLGIPKKSDKVEYLKIMFDYYVNLGIVSGIEGKINKIPSADKLELFFALARTRNIYSSGGSYTPFKENAEGQYVSCWNSSYLFTMRLPFRYGIDVSWQKALAPFSFTADITFFSDPHLKPLYENRSETLAWEKVFGLGDSTEDTVIPVIGDIQTNTTLDFGMTFTPKMKPDFNLLNKFSVSKFNISLIHKSKSISSPYEDDEIIGFFYPYQFTAPNLVMMLGGTVFNASIKQNSTSEIEQKDAVKDIKNPYEDEDSSEDNDESYILSDSFKLPDLLSPPEILLPSYYTSFSHALTYSIKPTLLLSGEFDYDSWHTPDLVDYDIEYYSIYTAPGADVNYTLSLYDSLIKLTNRVQLTSNYYTRFKDDDQVISDWDEQKENDKTKSNFTVLDTLTVTSKPLGFIDYFSNSAVTYMAGGYLFKYYYDPDNTEFTEDYLDLTDKSILFKHSVSSKVAFDADSLSSYLSYNTTLPPLDLNFSAIYSLTVSPFNLSVGYGGTVNEDDNYTHKPLTSTVSLNFAKVFKISQVINYDFEEDEFSQISNNLNLNLLDNNFVLTNSLTYSPEKNSIEKDSFKLKFYDLTATMSASYTRLYNFNIATNWTENLASEKTLRFSGFSVAYSKIIKELYFWKNRVFLDFSLNTSLNWDNLKVTNSSFDISLKTNFKIHKFLDLSVDFSSSNDEIYKYFAASADKVGIPTENIFLDLLRSFNIFTSDSMADRRATSFNLNKISIGLTHYLDDWILNVSLNVMPELVEYEDSSKNYEFATDFSIYVKWNPIPEIEKEFTVEDGEFEL